MNRTTVLAIVAALAAQVSPAGEGLLGDGEVSVLRKGREAMVRTKFSETRDLVVYVYSSANENAYLVDRASKTEDFRRGKTIHHGNDDFVPINFGNFGNIGGNHGSLLGIQMTVTNHGFTAASLGLAFKDSAGTPLRLIGIPDEHRLLLHSDGRPVGSRGLRYASCSGPYTCGDRTLTPTRCSSVQVYPVCRYAKFRWLLPSGEEVPDGVETRTTGVTLAMEYDIVDPRALVTHYADHPGKDLDPSPSVKWKYAFPDDPVADPDGRAAYNALLALARLTIDFSYQSGGARVMHRRIRYLQDAPSAWTHGFQYCWHPDLFRDASFYMPRMKPVTLKGVRGAPPMTVDLQALAPMAKPWSVEGRLGPDTWADPTDPPDRYIRRMDTGRDKVGVALGFSRALGDSAVGRPLRPRQTVYNFFWSGKMYPVDYRIEPVKAGRETDTWAYTQYFDPTAEPDATAFFHHAEGPDEVVYFDCHRTLKGKRLAIGPQFAGRAIRVLEKTPSVRLLTPDRVAADGTVTVDVADGYGTLVLRLVSSGTASQSRVPSSANTAGPASSSGCR